MIKRDRGTALAGRLRAENKIAWDSLRHLLFLMMIKRG